MDDVGVDGDGALQGIMEFSVGGVGSVVELDVWWTFTYLPYLSRLGNGRAGLYGLIIIRK